MFLIKTIPPYWTPLLKVFHQRVGDPDTEEEFLKSRSPLFKVDQIKIPMLIAQGANDPRVKQAESEQVVEAMKSKGIDYRKRAQKAPVFQAGDEWALLSGWLGCGE